MKLTILLAKPMQPETKDDKPKVEEVRAEVVDDVNDSSPDNEPFSDEVWGALGQAGITKGTLFAFLCVLILIFVVLGFVFFGGGDEDVVAKPEIVEEKTENESEVQKEEVIISNGSKSGEVAVGIVNSYIFGQEFRPIDPVPITYFGNAVGIEAAGLFGFDNGVTEVLLSADVRLIAEMENAFNTDVYLLLNQSTNRRKTLDEHIEMLENLVQRGDSAFFQIENDLIVLDEEFRLLNQQKESIEQLYFSSLDNNESEFAFEYFEQFVDLSQRMVAVRAEFKAKDYLRGRYVRVDRFLKPRVRDIKSNYEALIKGVRVFDIENSDIDAIIPL